MNSLLSSAVSRSEPHPPCRTRRQPDVPSGDVRLATPREAERRLRETKAIPAYLANEVPVAAADVAAQDLAPSLYIYAEGTRLMTRISLERNERRVGRRADAAPEPQSQLEGVPRMNRRLGFLLTISAAIVVIAPSSSAAQLLSLIHI